MIFRELVLQNFGPYQKRQVVDLRPGDNAQTIVLFGGMNGGGKTTLMDAIRLALYGQRALCSNRGTLNYAEFLSQCVSRQSENQATCIELTFEQTINNAPQPTQFRIRRTWTRQPKNGRDTLQIFEDGREDSGLAKFWDERIEDLLPLGISSLFLFDGEQVKELAEQEVPPPLVVGAIRSLLGLELPDRLSTDLEVLASRKRKALASSQELQKLEEIEQTLSTQEQERQSLKKKVASTVTRLEAAEEKLRQAGDRFLSEGGKIAAEQMQLENQLQQLKTHAEAQRQALRELAASVLPLALLQPLLQRSQLQIQQELRYEQFQAAQELLQERDQRLLSFISQQFNLPVEQIERIRAFLTQEDEGLAQPQEVLWMNADRDVLHQLVSVIEDGLSIRIKLAQERLTSFYTYQENIESTERHLATAASPEVYEKLKREVEQAQMEVTQLKLQHEQAWRFHEQLVQEINHTKQDLVQYSELTITRQNNEHILTATARVQDTLRIFKERLKLRKLKQLEDSVTGCFLYLLHKSNLVHQVQIDTDTFSLFLFDDDGQPIPKHRLSAGEKQLLAIALLWGLARASGRQLPIAIDTPLGRLDSSHRNHLLDLYFPQASHQVLLFSTDTEIGRAEVDRLRSEGVLAREYLLVYKPTERYTAIVPGYFW